MCAVDQAVRIDDGDVSIGPTIRLAVSDDVDEICQFGRDVVAPHYEPIVGSDEASAQIGRWWNAPYIRDAVGAGLLTVAEAGGALVGIAQRGRMGTDHVIYKLYVRPAYRNHGLGKRLIAAVVEQLPTGVDRLCVEQFAANTRAGAFYQREGFMVERVEPSSSGDPRRAQVWYARKINQN